MEKWSVINLFILKIICFLTVNFVIFWSIKFPAEQVQVEK